MEVLGKLLRLAKYQADERLRSVSIVNIDKQCFFFNFNLIIQERPGDILTNIDQQRADLVPNQGK